MGYFDDISFSYAGSVDVYRTFIKTKPHPSYFWSLEYCRCGGFVFTKNSGQTVNTFGPAVFWMSPGNQYSYGAGDNNWRSHAWANCSGARAERLIGALDKMWPAGYVKLDNETEFSDIYFRMLEHIASRSRKNHHKAVVCMEQLIGILTDIYLEQHEQPLINTRMDSLIEKIRFSPLLDYDFKSIAAKDFHMSYSGFRKFFKRINRVPPHEFVMIHKIYAAMELLKNGNLQIQEVASRLRFNDFSTFSRLFKKKTGISPSQYRKKYPMTKT